MTLLHRALAETPIAIIDLETTGLSAQGDRIVEVAVVRIDPGRAPRLVFETLVNPQRRVSGSEIHGIYDQDVIGAPTFRDIVGPVTQAVSGAVVASFNVYFDIKFLQAELALAEIPVSLPHLCLMWMRPGLGLGARGSLEKTCAELGVPFVASHQASADAMAAAQLWPIYADAAHSRGARTFADLAAIKSYKFVQSWDKAPLDYSALTVPPFRAELKTRTSRTAAEQDAARRAEWQAQDALSAYWDALTVAMADGVLTPSERSELRQLANSPHLTPEKIRYVHAKAYAGVLDEVSRDLLVDGDEVEWVASVTSMLRELGWAPGDPVRSRAATPAATARAAAPPPPAPSAPRPVSQSAPVAAASPSIWRRLFPGLFS